MLGKMDQNAEEKLLHVRGDLLLLVEVVHLEGWIPHLVGVEILLFVENLLIVEVNRLKEGALYLREADLHLH